MKRAPTLAASELGNLGVMNNRRYIAQHVLAAAAFIFVQSNR